MRQMQQDLSDGEKADLSPAIHMGSNIGYLHSAVSHTALTFLVMLFELTHATRLSQVTGIVG